MDFIELNLLLQKHDRSASWLARKLNISQTAVSKWLRGINKISEERANQIRLFLS